MGFHIDARDERLHTPTASPLWRESFWLDAHDAEQDMSLVIYAHARPASHGGDLFVCISGPGGARVDYDVQNIPHVLRHAGTVGIVGGLRHEFSEPSQRARITLDIPQAKLDLSFAACGPVYDYDWESWTASRHIEQFGLVQGAVKTAAYAGEFRGFATRDHAWGARAKVPWRRWVWITARFVGGKGWSACVVDADQPLLLGYFSDAGHEELTSASLTIQHPGGALTGGRLSLESASRRTVATVRSRVAMSRTGSDPTKGGSYNYYFVEVEDQRYGSGHGLLDVYSTPGNELRDSDTLTASVPSKTAVVSGK
jgi:hypothetical protein